MLTALVGYATTIFGILLWHAIQQWHTLTNPWLKYPGALLLLFAITLTAAGAMHLLAIIHRKYKTLIRQVDDLY